MKTHHKIFSILLVVFALFTAISFAQDNTEVVYDENYTYVSTVVPSEKSGADTLYSEWFSAEPNLGYSWYTNPPTYYIHHYSTASKPRVSVTLEGSNESGNTKTEIAIAVDSVGLVVDSLETLRFGTTNFNNFKFRYYRFRYITGSANPSDAVFQNQLLFIKPD